MLTAPNPGPMTLDGTNTFIVGRYESFVIDPGPAGSAYVKALAAWMQNQGIEPRGILLTHGHPDHAGGTGELSGLLDVDVWASPLMQRDIIPRPGSVMPLLSNTCFPVDGDILRVVPSPGHSRDHVAFLLEHARLLFAGDTILGRGTSVVAPPEGNMIDYLRTLAHFRTLDPHLIAPGHGPLVEDPQAAVSHYVDHRIEREREILAVLRRGPDTIPNIVRQVYHDLNPALRDLAAASVLAHLEKLMTEGVIVEEEGLYSVAAP